MQSTRRSVDPGATDQLVPLSPAEQILLEALEQHPRGIRTTDLAIAVGREAGNISRGLRRMSGYGLVTRLTYNDIHGAEITNRTFDTAFRWPSVTWKITEKGIDRLAHD